MSNMTAVTATAGGALGFLSGPAKSEGGARSDDARGFAQELAALTEAQGASAQESVAAEPEPEADADAGDTLADGSEDELLGDVAGDAELIEALEALTADAQGAVTGSAGDTADANVEEASLPSPETREVGRQDGAGMQPDGSEALPAQSANAEKPTGDGVPALLRDAPRMREATGGVPAHSQAEHRAVAAAATSPAPAPVAPEQPATEVRDAQKAPPQPLATMRTSEAEAAPDAANAQAAVKGSAREAQPAPSPAPLASYSGPQSASGLPQTAASGPQAGTAAAQTEPHASTAPSPTSATASVASAAPVLAAAATPERPAAEPRRSPEPWRARGISDASDGRRPDARPEAQALRASSVTPAGPAAQPPAGVVPAADPLLAPTASLLSTAPRSVSLEGGLGAVELGAQEAMRTASGAPGAGATAGAAEPRAVARQVAEAVIAAREGGVDLQLSPEELGRVRLSMTHADGGLVVSVSAERPETLDLLRRHIGLLGSELAAAGFGETVFSFGDQPREGSTPGSGDSATTYTGEADEAAPVLPDAPAVPRGALDIRV